MIHILCVHKDSEYKKWHSIGDVPIAHWDIDKDMQNVEPKPEDVFIAHPPCRAWGNFSWNSLHTEEEYNLAPMCWDLVNYYGGILEHPRSSKLWTWCHDKAHNDQAFAGEGSHYINVEQYWWGHRAKKPTTLFIQGAYKRQITTPLPIRIPTKPVEMMSTKERELTTPAMVSWMIQLAFKIHQNKR